MQCGFYQFLKKHWLVILVLLAIPIIFVLLLACLAFCDIIEIDFPCRSSINLYWNNIGQRWSNLSIRKSKPVERTSLPVK